MLPVFDSAGLATEPGEIRCFYYDPFSLEYAGFSDEFIHIGVSLPGYPTAIVPGAEIAGYVRVFTGESWEQREDHRGALAYSTTDGAPSIVDYVGAIKEGFVTTAPTTPYDVWGNSGWVTDNQKLKAAQVAEAEQEKTRLQSIAASQISILQDATDPGVMGDNILPGDIALLKLWRQYRVLLNRIDTSTAPNIIWPESPVG